MQSARDVTIWASEFDARRVPPVCVKSGLPADGTWTFLFLPPGSNYISLFAAKRFRIPLTRGWLTGFTALVAIRAIALAVAIPCFLLSLLIPQPPPVLRTVWYVGVGVSLLAALGFWITQPRGSIHSLPTGQTWLLLVGVHPAFVDAVDRSRMPAAGLFSPDCKWFWDGRAWLNNDFPEQWWRRTFFGGFERQPRLQLTLAGIGIIVGLGALAWWNFHR